MFLWDLDVWRTNADNFFLIKKTWFGHGSLVMCVGPHVRPTQIALHLRRFLIRRRSSLAICVETCAVGSLSDANNGPRSDANRWFCTSVGCLTYRTQRGISVFKLVCSSLLFYYYSLFGIFLYLFSYILLRRISNILSCCEYCQDSK